MKRSLGCLGLAAVLCSISGGSFADAAESDLWVAFLDRCLHAYLADGTPVIDDLVEVAPARDTQRAFRSRDESLLMILDTAPEDGLHACKLYGFHASEEPAGKAGFVGWRTEVLANGEFEADGIGRLFSTDGAPVSLLVDARNGENVTVYEVVARD